ncbi:glycosyltransferase [Actinoplanes sp. NPDC049599]|uniref:glycosyltransferase n=1 Tax=Actinoplanes sp. NPDC049599 TaxID=3363903 RepID=UPI003798F4D1
MNVVLCSVAAEGHIGPMLAVARGLRDRGWRVRFITGARFADQVAQAGAEFVALPPDADVLDRLDRTRRRSGRAVLNEELRPAFLDPAPGQARALLGALAQEPADAVLAESAFLGVAALHAQPAGQRPLHVLCGVIPLGLPSVDVAPFGLGLTPLPGPLGRLRNRFLTWLATRVILRQAHADTDRTLRELGAGGLQGQFLTSGQRDADLIAQFTVESFEYPRSDAPDHLVFVGPMTRTARHPPAAEDPPIVHVTQGTVANRSWTDLVSPALEGLADLPVRVLVSTGGRDLDTLPQLPANAEAVEFLDYPEALPRCSVFVTNGGYGGLHAALEHGLPIVVAGDTEDKKETSARVEWAGAGINLHTGQPTPTAIRQAVRQILAEPAYAAASRRIGAQIAGSPGVAGLAERIEELVSRRPPAPRSRSGNPDGPGR